MLIGIMSDSHDNIWNLAKALQKMKIRGVDAILHCGDLASPFIVEHLDSENVPVHIVFGNVADRYLTEKMVEKARNVTLHGDMAELKMDNKKIAMVHDPEFGKALAKTKRYDIVFYGHTHIFKQEKVGKTLLVNPGEIMGRKAVPTFAIYNTENDTVEFIEIPH